MNRATTPTAQQEPPLARRLRSHPRSTVLRGVASAAALILCAGSAFSAEKAPPEKQGAILYKQACASCHPGGGNAVNQSKPVAGSDTLATLATFKQYLQSPTGHMPYYKNVIKDRDLLEALYKYCKSLEKPPKQACLPGAGS